MTIESAKIYHSAGKKCPACNSSDTPKGGILILVHKEEDGQKRRGLQCSRHPDCKMWIDKAKRTK